MPPFPPAAAHFRHRLIGLYALTVMEREGTVHGYGVSELIAERTDGAWRPGPGAVYPSLKKLVGSGCARATLVGRRRVYAITPKGRQLLAAIRSRGPGFRDPRADLGALWAEVMGMEGVEGLLELRLRRTLEAIETFLARPARSPAARERFRARVVDGLARSLERVRRPPLVRMPIAASRGVHAR